MTQVVMATGQEASRNARPASAGFMKFLPMPPNRHFAKMMENRAPITMTHSGADTGDTKESSTPVTTADRSPVESGLPAALQKIFSKTTQAMTVTAVCSSARGPNMKTATAIAGISAMMTSSMIERVSSLALICGEEVITTLLKSYISLLLYFFAAAAAALRLSITRILATRNCCTSGMRAGQTYEQEPHSMQSSTLYSSQPSRSFFFAYIFM